ncbi:MAG: oligosaccharide flippase family protein [Paludibacteraceae bacterium]|nr:oligosaccharide flippase family protein [Paludibacteraceae bacterium]
MTILSVLSALISFFIYPFVVRMTGTEAFGVYPFALAIVFYFQILIDFGFDSPSAKAIVEHRNDDIEKSRILSEVFSAKLLLFIACSILYCILVLILPDMRQNKLIFILTYAQTFASVLYPTWYFQGMKNMRVVTYINIALRLLTIPFILLFVRTPESVWVYAMIISFSAIMGGVVAFVYIITRDKLNIHFVSPKELAPLFQDGLPFFITSLTGQLKEGLLTIVVRYCFGYSEVTLFDIAKKLVSIPRMFTQNINGALFPEVMQNVSVQRVKKILRYDRIIGLVASLGVILLAYPTILLLFGKEAIDAAPITIILSWSLYTWLVVGAYLNFVFIPNHKYYYITINQTVALATCLVFLSVLFIWNNMITIALALTLSGFCEILFCKYITHKKELL